MKKTEKETKELIQAEIESADNKRLLELLGLIYDQQTTGEKLIEATAEQNGKGFSSADAEFLSSVCAKARQYGHLTEKQAVYVRRYLKKYWRQLAELLSPVSQE